MVEDSPSIPEAPTPNSKPIVTEVKDSIAIVRFNRPAQRNPLSHDTLKELKRISSALINDEDIASIVFTGTANVFASGVDIRELAQLDLAAALEFSQSLIDIGRPSPAFPVTPPCIRVRTRRFGELSFTDQRGKTERSEVSIGQGDSESGRVTESPRAMRATGCLRSQVFTYTPFA